MTAIKPPTVLNSFREHPVDKTGLQSPIARPRANEGLQEHVRAANAKPAAKPADRLELSAEAKNISAKPAVMKTEAQAPAQVPTQVPSASATAASNAAKGKPINLLA